jgi:hypothetical protein
MNSKLTLRMDESLIAQAKDYAAAHGSSVSQMVANYFAALSHKAAEKKSLQDNASRVATPGIAHTGPVTLSLIGILKPRSDQPPVSEEDYYAYLERKHLDASNGAAR